MSEGARTAASEPLDALLNAAVDAIVIIDAQGLILQFNPAAEKMFGHARQDVVGKNVSILMPEPYHSQHDQHVRAYREGGPAAIIGIGREVRGLKANGEIFPIHLSVGEIGGSGRARFVGIIRDQSVEKATQATVRELETHLAHAERLVMLGELTAGIAHEINQPLTAIAAYADAGAHMLRSGDREAVPELDNICERVAEQARRAGDVVTRLRMLSRKGALTRGRHDVSGLVKSVLLLFEHEFKSSNITLETDFEPNLPKVSADDIQLQQVLVNLIKNSIDALKAYRIEDPKIRIHLYSEDGNLHFKVSDNGPGVPADLVARLFEPFFTTKLRGVGLGLSICKNIAAAHGGKLTFARSAEGGAEFTLSLPLDYIG